MPAFIQRGSIEARFLTTAPADPLAVTQAEWDVGTDIIHGDPASAECLQEADGLSTQQQTIEYDDACSLDSKTLRGQRQLGTAVLRYIQDKNVNLIRDFFSTPNLAGYIVVTECGDTTAGKGYTIMRGEILQKPETLFAFALAPSRYEVQMSKNFQDQGVFA